MEGGRGARKLLKGPWYLLESQARAWSGSEKGTIKAGSPVGAQLGSLLSSLSSVHKSAPGLAWPVDGETASLS